jgi:RNA polymerase sigma-70 factor (ECF subfamily)
MNGTPRKAIEKAPPDSTAWSGGWPQSLCEFEAFVEAFQDRLVRYAFRRLGNKEDAEDVVQEVFVRVYRDRACRKRVDHVTAYLFRMAANACSDHLRRQEPRRGDLSFEEGVSVEANLQQRPVPSEVAAATEELLRIERFLGRLTSRQAEVIRLHVFDELSFAEIAQVIGRSTATVKSRFRYGLQKLKSNFRKDKEVSP